MNLDILILFVDCEVFDEVMCGIAVNSEDVRARQRRREEKKVKRSESFVS
jgi:hypothetical protein